MVVELRKLSPDDGIDVYNMLQEMPSENGFGNSIYGLSYDEYKQSLIKRDNISKGIGLEDWMVPQNIYWLYIYGRPVGQGNLRHRLTDSLRIEGGHCGYGIAPSQRGKGYGKLLLSLMKDEARALGIDRMLITVYNDNPASIRVAVSNGGVIENVTDKRHYIWIDL